MKSRRQTPSVEEEPRRLFDILPHEEDLVSSNCVFNEFSGVLGGACSAMLVNHGATGCHPHRPSSPPSLPRQIRIFEIEGIVKSVEASQHLEFPPVNSAGTTTGPQHGNGFPLQI